MNLISGFTHWTQLIVDTKGHSMSGEAVWRQPCYIVLLPVHALQWSFPAHCDIRYSPHTRVILVVPSLGFSQVFQKVTKAEDKLWFPLLWQRLKKHPDMLSTVLARDEKLSNHFGLTDSKRTDLDDAWKPHLPHKYRHDGAALATFSAARCWKYIPFIGPCTSFHCETVPHRRGGKTGMRTTSKPFLTQKLLSDL